jgi:hypothetical protein
VPHTSCFRSRSAQASSPASSSRPIRIARGTSPASAGSGLTYGSTRIGRMGCHGRPVFRAPIPRSPFPSWRSTSSFWTPAPARPGACWRPPWRSGRPIPSRRRPGAPISSHMTSRAQSWTGSWCSASGPCC